MLYTINQISLRLGKTPKTIYRACKQYSLGELYDVAEGRRLLFTEDELDQLENVIFVDNRKEKLLQNDKIKEIVDILRQTPMTLYQLSRKTHLSKGTLQSYIMAMSSAFTELAEDNTGVLYFLDGEKPPRNHNAYVRRVYYSEASDMFIFWETPSNVEDIQDSTYHLVQVDRCFYIYDDNGKMAFENDMVLHNGKKVIMHEGIKNNFIIVGNTYEEDIC